MYRIMEQKKYSSQSILILLLIIFVLLCYLSQNNKSVTVDEFNHFPSGIYNILTMDWRMDHESPPLIKCLPAVTSLFTQPAINLRLFERDPNPWNLGYHFMYGNQKNYQNIFRYGRCVVIFLGCLLGLLIYRFGKEIYGVHAGLFALFLYVFNPNIIAHSSLTTIDLGASLTIFLSVYCFWKYLKRIDTSSLIVTGITLGLAQLSKFTALLLYPIFILILIMLVVRKNNQNDKSAINNQPTLIYFTHIFIIFIISLLVINLGYLFSGCFTPVADYHFTSEPLKRISTFFWGEMPVPLPYDYLMGFDTQLALSGGNYYSTYLMGEHSMNGWWYYYIVAFIVKSPISLLLVLLISIVYCIKKRVNRLEDLLCIWIPVAVFFFYFSFLTHIPIGIRFLLPVFPFLFVAAGNLFDVKFIINKSVKIVFLVLIISYSFSALYIYPNYLTFFNIIAGGPGNGYRWLIDSNLDWGQDLPGLKKYMDSKGIEEVKLGYFGRVDPEIYGIKYTVSKGELEPGIHAISINYLVGYPYFILKNNSKEFINIGLDYFKKFRTLKPVDVINNTIYIFNIENRRKEKSIVLE
jgi:hypothetical protein